MRSFDEVTGSAMEDLVRAARDTVSSVRSDGVFFTPDGVCKFEYKVALGDCLEVSHPSLFGVRVSITLNGFPKRVSLHAAWFSGMFGAETPDCSLVGIGEPGVLSASQSDVLDALSKDGLQGYRDHVKRFFHRLCEHGVDLHRMADEALASRIMNS